MSDLSATDSLVAALRAVMARLTLTAGCVGDYDGAYDWVKVGSTAPEDAPGDHPATSGWPEDSYTVLEVGEPSALAAAAREWIKGQMPEPMRGPALDPLMAGAHNAVLADVARKLGLS